MSMRNITGMLYLVLTLIKVLYITEIEVLTHVRYLIVIFFMDFTVYILLAFILVLFDYTRHCTAKRHKKEQMSDVFRNMPVGIVKLNSKGEIIHMNNIVIEALQESEYSFLLTESANIHEMVALPFDREWPMIMERIAKGMTYSVEFEVTWGGKQHYHEFLFIPNQRVEQNPNQLLTINCLIINSRRPHKMFVNDDSVLVSRSIPNKYKLMELMEHGIKDRLMQNFGVILIKILNYDDIVNMINSHETQTMDHLLVSKLQKLDFIYAIGKLNHDTFEIITDDTSDRTEIHEAVQYVKDIILHQTYFDNEMNEYVLDYRIGVAMAPNDGLSQKELSRCASIAIAKATTEERGNVQFYYEHIQDDVATKLHLETKLHNGIVGEQLYIEYQPEYDIQTGDVRGFEALVRWRMSDGKIMMPGEFLPIAEEVGLMEEIGEWVLRNAIPQALEWNRRFGLNLQLSVNVSASQLEMDGFADSVIGILDEMTYPKHMLELEVTESKMTGTTDRGYIELKRLQDAGVKIAIDDFGNGYTTMDYLKLLPFDVLKIDRKFIERINDHDVDSKIVESIIELVTKMDITSIVEGVETDDQLEFLKGTSCDYVQGFVHSKPMTAEGVMEMISGMVE